MKVYFLYISVLLQCLVIHCFVNMVLLLFCEKMEYEALILENQLDT